MCRSFFKSFIAAGTVHARAQCNATRTRRAKLMINVQQNAKFMRLTILCSLLSSLFSLLSRASNEPNQPARLQETTLAAIKGLHLLQELECIGAGRFLFSLFDLDDAGDDAASRTLDETTRARRAAAAREIRKGVGALAEAFMDYRVSWWKGGKILELQSSSSSSSSLYPSRTTFWSEQNDLDYAFLRNVKYFALETAKALDPVLGKERGGKASGKRSDSSFFLPPSRWCRKKLAWWKLTGGTDGLRAYAKRETWKLEKLKQPVIIALAFAVIAVCVAVEPIFYYLRGQDGKDAKACTFLFEMLR